MSNLPPQDPNPFARNAEPVSGPNATQAAASNSSGLKIVLIILGVLFFGMLACGGVLLARLLPAVGAAREAAQRMQRSNNAKHVGLAIHNYHSAYNHLPFTTNTNLLGETTVTWRVALSPFVEASDLWDRVDPDQAWDGPSNNQLASEAPIAFQVINGEPGQTGIFAIVAAESMFPPTPQTPIRFRDVLDGLSTTVMAIELPNRSATWTSNQNLTPDEAYQAITELEGAQVAHLLMGDGAVRAVTSSLSRETFDAIVTRAGGEMVTSF